MQQQQRPPSTVGELQEKEKFFFSRDGKLSLQTTMRPKKISQQKKSATLLRFSWREQESWANTKHSKRLQNHPKSVRAFTINVGATIASATFRKH